LEVLPISKVEIVEHHKFRNGDYFSRPEAEKFELAHTLQKASGINSGSLDLKIAFEAFP